MNIALVFRRQKPCSVKLETKLNMEEAKIANFAISQYFNIFIIVATQTQWQTYCSNLALNFAIFTKWWKPYNIQSAVSVRVCLDNLHYFNIMSLSSVQNCILCFCYQILSIQFWIDYLKNLGTWQYSSFYIKGECEYSQKDYYLSQCSWKRATHRARASKLPSFFLFFCFLFSFSFF